jgi:uncharacterized protein
MKYIRRVALVSLVIMISQQLHAQIADTLKLKDYRPVSIYKIPVSVIPKAKFPVTDFHSHDYPDDAAGVDAWVKTMDKAGIAKTMILTYSTGKAFDSAVAKYSKYKDRFEIWCGIDFTGYKEPGWEQKSIKELERCHGMGATGVGELGDKGLGEFYSKPVEGWGMHIDNPKLKPFIKRCGELGMPISIHVAEDAWMYEKPDASNDGLMNAAKWQVDMSKPGILNHDQLVQTLENAVRDNPNTTFIACHLANTCSDLSMIAKMFDKYPNLYADMAARFGELAPIPRHVSAFMEKYADRLVYGTDMGVDHSMYMSTFRILESADEHFYDHDLYGYHWPLNGFKLSDSALKKIYSENGKRIMTRSSSSKK